ncbi:hypothetical protein Tco_0731564 [Tanacetum coccineum]
MEIRFATSHMLKGKSPNRGQSRLEIRQQLERENLHGVNAKTCLQALRTQFKEFLASKGVNATDLLNQGGTILRTTSYERSDSRAKVQSLPQDQKQPISFEQRTTLIKPVHQKGIGQRFSLNKSSTVHEKPYTPRSCLRWKPTGRIFKTVGLRNSIIKSSVHDVSLSLFTTGSCRGIGVLAASCESVVCEQKRSKPRLPLMTNVRLCGITLQCPFSLSKERCTAYTEKRKVKRRVARLEQEMSEVKKTDHSADVLASIKSQVPTSIKNLESKKSPKEIIRIKREQGEEKHDSTYSIRSTDKVALEEFDLKNEDAIDKEVTVKVKDHKRKHDSDDEEDDDDDEGPSAGSNQVRDEPGKTTMETEVESMVTVPIQQVFSYVPLLILQSSISHLLNQYLLPVKNHSLQLSPPTSALQQSSSVLEMVKSRLLFFLSPQRQEMSVENVSSGLVPQGQKVSDYDNSDPVPPRQNVVPTAEKIDSSQQGLEFLFSPLLEEYYNPTHGQAEENNNNQAPNASF